MIDFNSIPSQVIASGTGKDDLENYNAQGYDIPPGTPVRIKLQLPSFISGASKLANIGGAEYAAQFFVKAQMTVEDVSGDDQYIYIQGTANGSPLALILIALIALLAVIGLYVLKGWWIESGIPEVLKGIGQGIQDLSKAASQNLMQLALIIGAIIIVPALFGRQRVEVVGAPAERKQLAPVG